MLETLKFLIVEDKAEDRNEVLSRLADAGFLPANKLGAAETYQDAKTLLEEHAATVDVVFLDLNLPRDVRDGRPEKSHGKAILDIIHTDLNRRAGNDIRVIVVSGEDLQDGVQDQLFYDFYKGTLVSIAQKAELPRMLKASVKRLKKDPMRSRIRRGELDVLEQYEVVGDPSKPIKERLKGARALVIRLVQNEVDHYRNRRGSCEGYSDDLNGLIKDHIESRFSEDRSGKRRIKASMISVPGGWGSFLWRGSMVQHLYAINNYRNLFEHIEEQPYRCQGAEADAWTIPLDVLRAVEVGEAVGKLLELTVNEILDWYLPWHEQVYVPWAKAQAGGQR
jgi:CheY-like chemotaxis protein